MRPLRETALFLILGLVGSVYAQTPAAPAWQSASTLADVDLSELTPAQKQTALKLLREMDCTCGCSMKVAQCRVEDPACSYSKAIAGMVVSGLKDGKTPAEVKKTVASSAVGHPRQPQKVLEDPVKLNTGGAPALGPANAKLVLVEFSDFECPYCAKAAAEIRQIASAYPKDVRLVYKQFPLSMHPHAEMAAAASLAAQEQGKFWEMHDLLFANYRQLSRERVVGFAQQLGLDLDKFKAAMDSPKYKAEVQKDLKEGTFAGVNGTPSLFVNGQHYNGQISLAVMKPLLDQELKKP